MDLLVTLCASYHLSPSDYTVEVLSTNKNNISFKPNSPIGSLEAEKIVLKPKGVEEKIKRPYIPEVNQIEKSLKYIRISGVCLPGDVTWTLPPTGLRSSAHQLQQVPQGRGEGESQGPPGAAAAHNLRQVRVQGGHHRPAERLAVWGAAGPQQEFERARPEGSVRQRHGRRVCGPRAPIGVAPRRYFPVGNPFEKTVNRISNCPSGFSCSPLLTS